ncbi:MAG: ABC transporter permease [Myxococcaceae bacterium]|nr:ABC transporter permease [Myxococcaceae bacterium]
MNSVWMALREVTRRPMRSLLTMVGIVIGVAAVIAMVTLGSGATAKIRANIGALGDDLLTILPEVSQRQGGQTVAGAPFEHGDVEALGRELPGLELVVPATTQRLQVVSGSTNRSTSVTGTTSGFLRVRSYRVSQGVDVEAALDSSRSVCVLGAKPAKTLFGGSPALGQTLRVGTVSCEVVGVLAEKGSGLGEDPDEVVLMPLKAFEQRVSGNRKVGVIYATAKKGRPTGALKRQVEQLLHERRRIRPGEANDFGVRDMKDIADTVATTTSLLTSLLGAVAAISLLVGGIGIMNIMLVSVTERTREIGTRLAIGALASDVLRQFLVEASVLSSLGGAVGVVVGLGGAFGLSLLLGFPFSVSWALVLGAFVFSAGVGVLFGFLPARTASRLSPIEALRHE